jgi:hypothetical protein
LVCQIFLKSTSLLANFQWSKFHGNWWCFKSTCACLKHSKTLLWTMVFFPSFFVSNVHNSFSNSERIYILTIKIEWIKVNEIHVYNAFYHFWCKHDFGLQNYEIWGCVFKIIHFHITIIMDAKIHYIWSRCNKNLFIFNT